PRPPPPPPPPPAAGRPPGGRRSRPAPPPPPLRCPLFPPPPPWASPPAKINDRSSHNTTATTSAAAPPRPPGRTASTSAYPRLRRKPGGSMIEMIPAPPDQVVGFVAKGQVTKEDYEQRLVPVVEQALAAGQGPPPVRLGRRFHRLHGWRDVGGWRARSFPPRPVGAHRRRRQRALGPPRRQRVRISLPGEVKVCDLKDEADAAAWVTA